MSITRKSSRNISVLAGSAVLLVLMGSVNSAESTTGIKPAPAFTARQLTALPTDGWITNGGNLYNQRYSPLKRINRENVKQLKGKWRTHLEGSGLGATYSGQGQPIVHDGVIYMSTGASDAFALSVDTGQILWRYTAGVDSAKVRVCCGWVNRGLALGDGKVFVGQLNARVVALDQRTGKEIWSVQAEDSTTGFSITAAPLYYDGLVIVGFAGGEAGIRGRIKAYDAKTGKLVWTFYTVPGPGEVGHDTWPADNDAWKYGGAPIWNTPAVDPELGMVYFSTGNAGMDYNGAHRAGDNLFSVSIVALDVRTGKYRWHFQQVHHDIWDYDSPNPVILFDAPYAGKMRKGIAEVSKTGWVYILDRETGKPLTGIEEKPVPQELRQKTAATQPFPIGDAVVPQQIDEALPAGIELINQGRIFTPFWDKTVLYKPQMGVNWPPSSVDPVAHRMFICGTDHVGASSTDGKDFTVPAATGFYTGMGSGGNVNHGIPRRGTFNAIDLTTNRLVWQQKWPTSDCMNGTMATGGGLVFVGRADGRLTALDSSNGNQIWEFQTDAGVYASASTFEHRGKQYVVVLSAGSAIGQNKRGDSVWLFSLDGTLKSLPPDAGAVTPAGPRGGGPDAAQEGVTLPPGAADLAKGAAQYRLLCLACHGETGQGGQNNGVSLAAIARTPQLLANTAWNGKNNMPPFRDSLTPEQIRDIALYISEQLLPQHQ